mmetsp:Transcript_33574/g.100073  ORF Transcript_33574/g.100073 Transcript_33574/m.100073 type:complete len:100 (+) Transcript_33574:1140-1439(+)
MLLLMMMMTMFRTLLRATLRKSRRTKKNIPTKKKIEIMSTLVFSLQLIVGIVGFLKQHVEAFLKHQLQDRVERRENNYGWIKQLHEINENLHTVLRTIT